MLGNLSIPSKLLALLAVPVAGTALLGATGLAGRLRRNAETLPAMAGPEPARPGTGPQPLAEVLRAAVAEAEPGGARRDGRVDLLVAGEVAVRARPPSTRSTCWPSCSTTRRLLVTGCPISVSASADRNGFGVRLGRSPAGGVTAAVRLPRPRSRAARRSRPACPDRPGPPALTGGFARPDPARATALPARRPAHCASPITS